MKIRKRQIKYKLHSLKKSKILRVPAKTNAHANSSSKTILAEAFQEHLTPPLAESEERLTSSKENKYTSEVLNASVTWAEERKQCIDALVNNHNFCNEMCLVCFNSPGEFKCEDCKINSSCKKCIDDIHTHVKLHCPKKWNGTYFEDYICDQLFTIQTAHTNDCEKSFFEMLPVVDSHGRMHKRCQLKLCSCECKTAFFYSVGLWPNHPTHPTMVFDVSFLKKASVLQMEGKLSLYAFCLSMAFVDKENWTPQPNVYRHLTKFEAFEEFKFVEQMKLNLGDVKNDITCPSCFENPYRTYILDGNFSAVHKRSSSKINTTPRYQSNLFIEADLEESSFDTSYQSCTNFRAGDYVRSKECLKKLDIQGLFAGVCRHEFWRVLINMNSGERFSYPVSAIKEMLSDSPNSQVNIVYDVACKLKEYISRRSELQPLLNHATLSIDQFHAYGHNSFCQIFNTVRCVENVGLTSGSQMERQWPIIRKTAPQTKEMSLSHRHDFIVNLVLHEHFKRRFNLAKSFSKWKHYALSVIEENSNKLEALKKEHNISVVNQKTIDHWLLREKIAQGENSSSSDTNSILRELQNLAVERQFILQMIKRYPTGQHVNIRLNKELKRQTKKRRKLVEVLRLQDVKFDYRFFLNPESIVFLNIDASLEGLSRTFRLQIINAWRLIVRAKEELRLIALDCQSARKYFVSICDQIAYEGENNIILKAFYYRKYKAFQKFIDDLNTVDCNFLSDSEDDYDIDSYDDSDSDIDSDNDEI